jgi:hypothetical protein
VIESLNPAAIVFRTVQTQIEGALPEARGERRIVPAGHAHFLFDTVSFKLAAGSTLEMMERLMADLATGHYGAVVRAKALVETDQGPWKFDLVFSKRSSGPFTAAIAESRMVVIGEALAAAAIRRAAGAAC